jgi:hypothetical protein
VAAAAQSSATMLSFSSTATDWVDVHYTVNGGEPQTVRMKQGANGASSFTAAGLKKGDVVEYRFTYWDAQRKAAVDSASHSVEMK